MTGSLTFYWWQWEYASGFLERFEFHGEHPETKGKLSMSLFIMPDLLIRYG